MPAAPHILFAGGGSPGHLYPGLAVAEAMRREQGDVEITFAGSGKTRERYVVRSAGFQYIHVPSQPAPSNPLQALRFVTDNVAGYCAARWMLREQQISLVVGLGGSTSSAVVRAAIGRGVPVVLLEQNAVPTRSTCWLARWASTVCVAFEEARAHLPEHTPVVATGTPVRQAFSHHYSQTGPTVLDPFDTSTRQAGARRQKRLVILGGAGGARSLNEAVPLALQKLGDRLAGWQIVHQTGEGQLHETDALYQKCGVSALTVSYIDDMASVEYASDLAVARAGGTTLAELALTATPAVLVPFPQAIDDHQTANAAAIASAGACRVIDEGAAGTALDAALARELEPLLADTPLRGEMARAMQRLARPHAARDIARVIQQQMIGPVRSLYAA